MRKLFTTVAVLLAAAVTVSTSGAVSVPVNADGIKPVVQESAGINQPVPQVKFRTLNETKDKVHLILAVPEFSGFKGADTLNRQIGFQIREDVSTVKDNAKNPGKTGVDLSDHLYYSSGTAYSAPGNGLISVWTNYEVYSGGAHGSHGIMAHTVNMRTGEFYDRPDFIFQNKLAGTKWLTDQIVKKMDADPQTYMDFAKQTVKNADGDFKFYLDGDKLVVYFDPYEVTSYAEGTQFFEFPLKDIPKSLPLTIPLTGNAGHGTLSVDGAPASMANAPIMDKEKGQLLPLEDVANLLGKKAVNSGGTWSVDGKAAEVKMTGGVPYVAPVYFSDTLGEVVLYDGVFLNVFHKGETYAVPSGTAPTYLSDTTANLSVNKAYTFRITTPYGAQPVVFAGTEGIFKIGIVKRQGNDYYVRIMAIGKPGSAAGIYIENATRPIVATVKANVNTVLNDTPAKFTIKQGTTYQFLLTAAACPKFACGNGNMFLLTFSGFNANGEYFFTATAIGKKGDCAGFYINGEKTPRSVATIV